MHPCSFCNRRSINFTDNDDDDDDNDDDGQQSSILLKERSQHPHVASICRKLET